MLVQVSLVLPYLLRLSSGRYPTDSGGYLLNLRERYLAEVGGSGTKRTAVSSVFEAPGSAGPERQFALKKREADALLRQTSRLIRWYRSQTRQSAVVEVTRAEASPFVFTDKATNLVWGDALAFEADPPALPMVQSVASATRAVRLGMAGGGDPEVSSLFLLDAEQALRDGRFREAVLFCWSTIDTTFNTKYEVLVDQALAGEWSKGRDWLKDNQFGMKNKMSAILFLTTGRSLFREPADFWENLSTSYGKRNRIIHSGETAQEADAELALKVARGVTNLMASLKLKTARPRTGG